MRIYRKFYLVYSQDAQQPKTDAGKQNESVIETAAPADEPIKYGYTDNRQIKKRQPPTFKMSLISKKRTSNNSSFLSARPFSKKKKKNTAPVTIQNSLILYKVLR